MEKGNKASRDKDRRNSSLKMKSQKLNHSVWDLGLSSFSITDRVQLGFEIYFVLERFSCIHVKELHHAAYKYIGHGRLM
jgi:hypothetical protein